MTATRLLYVLLATSVLMTTAAGCARHSEEQSTAAAEPAAHGPASATRDTGTVERKLVRTAAMSLRVADPAQAQAAAERLARKLGGHVDRSEAYGDAEQRDIELTLRVPTARLDRALDGLRRLGEVEHESVDTRDVTEQHVDLAARLDTRRELEKRYVGLLAEANTVEAALKVEAELGRVREEVERLEGKQRLLNDQVSLSTVELRLNRKRPLVRASASDLSDASRHAYADAINVSGALVSGGIRAAGILAPVLVLLVLPLGLGLRFGWRRLRRRGLV